MQLEDIIKGCKEGNRKCQDALVQKFAPGLLALCMRYTSDREMARDALQETFISVFRFMDKFEGKGSFEGWIRRIAVTSSIATNRKYSRLHFDEIKEQDDWQHTSIPDIYQNLAVQDIMALLKQLPDSLYLVFNLCIVEGYSHEETAAILGIAEATSRSALCKARNRLAEIVKKQSDVLAYAS